MRRMPYVALLAAYLGVVLYVTLRPNYDVWQTHVYLVPFVDTWYQMRDLGELTAVAAAAGNVVMFVPLGYLLPAAFRPLRRSKRAIIAGGSLSVVIELLQWLFGEGRNPSIDDVMYNTIGTAIGATLFVLLTGLWRNKRARRPQAG